MENIQESLKKVTELKTQLYTLVSNKVTENDLATADEREHRMKTTNVNDEFHALFNDQTVLNTLIRLSDK